jgi:predicted CopG family antitoxin
MKRKLITVRLDDGYVLKISNRAKKQKRTFSDILREIISAWCAGR